MSAKQRILPVFIPHFGCPHNCVFCDQKTITGENRPVTPETVRSKIEQMLSENRGNEKVQLAFYGGSFTAIPAGLQTALLQAVLPYIEEGIIDSVRVSTRPDAIDRECLERLKEFHVRTIEIGAQSMDEEVLALSGRGHSADDVRKAAVLIRQYGFELIIQMMTGLPGDTQSKTYETAVAIASLHPDGVRIYPSVILRNTPLYDRWKNGEYHEHSVEEAVEFCAAIVPVFRNAGIQIIRLGLNPSDDLSSGEAAGGAYHPALGELVLSRIRYNEMAGMLQTVPSGSDVTIVVPAALLSQYTGQHRKNVEKLKTCFGLNSLRIRPGQNDTAFVQISSAPDDRC